MGHLHISPNDTSIIVYFLKACFNSIVHHVLTTDVLWKYVIFEVSLSIYEIPPSFLLQTLKWRDFEDMTTLCNFDQ